MTSAAQAVPPTQATPPPPWQRTTPPAAPTGPIIDTERLAERIEANTTTLQTRLAALLGRLDALNGSLRRLSQDVIDAAHRDAAAASAAAERALDAGEAELERHRASEAARTGSVIAALLDDLAPGTASIDLCTPIPDEAVANASLASHQRVGTSRNASATGIEGGVPVVAPLRVGSGWMVGGDAAGSAALLLNTLSRLLLQAHPSRIRIHTFDPRSSGTLARLAGLRGISPTTFPHPHASAAPFAARVEEALVQAPLNAERAALAGAIDFVDLWRKDPTTEATLSVFVLLDYPSGVTPELNSLLQQLATLGPAAGTLLLVQENASLPAADRVLTSTLTSVLSRIDSTAGSITTPWTGGLVVAADGDADARAIETVIQTARRRLADDTGQTVLLESLLDGDLRSPWSRTSLDEVEALLGVAGRDLLPLRFRSENPPQSNVLLGGMVGTGKSNALKSIIYSAAARYSPTELEFVLLDFKAGIEFKSFDADDSGEGWLPHVSVLGLESDQEYGIAVLTSVAAEIDRRSRLFRDAGGASSIIRYRETTGEPLPRLVVVIDEFHVILEGDEDLAAQAADLLELIAKQGRAFGVHLLLASQALTGIRGLRTKADAIFSQFPTRVSLKNSPSESQAFLSQGNHAAADLTYRGEVIVNRNLGQSPATDNIRGLAAYVDQTRFARLQRDLWRRDPSRRPRVFVGSALAQPNPDRWRNLPRASRTGVPLDVWIGRPVAVDDAPAVVRLRPDADQLVALVGGDQGRVRVAPAVLSSIIVSAARQFPSGSEIVVLDASGDDTIERLQASLTLAGAEGQSVHVIGERDIAAYVRDELSTRIDDRSAPRSRLIVAVGVQRIPGIDDPGAAAEDANVGGFSFGASSAPTARDILADTARRGALAGVYLVGWWSSLAAMEQTMGLSHNGVLAYVTVSAGTEDTKRIAGPLTKRFTGSPRVGLHDRRSDAPLQPVVPFAPMVVAGAAECREGRSS